MKHVLAEIKKINDELINATSLVENSRQSDKIKNTLFLIIKSKTDVVERIYNSLLKDM